MSPKCSLKCPCKRESTDKEEEGLRWSRVIDSICYAVSFDDGGGGHGPRNVAVDAGKGKEMGSS